MLNKSLTTLALLSVSLFAFSTHNVSATNEKLGRALFKNLHVVVGPQGKININQVKALALSKQLGITLKDAKTIVAQRKKGGYKNKRQLRALKGLSRETLNKLNRPQFAFGKGTKESTSAASAKPKLL